MKKRMKKRTKIFTGIIICILTLIIVVVGILINDNEEYQEMEENRVKYEQQIKVLKQNYELEPTIENTFEYSQKLFQLGDFKESKDLLLELLKTNESYEPACYLLARIEYLNGNYQEAEKLYNYILENFPNLQEKAEAGLAYVYYQTNQFSKAQNLPVSSDFDSGIMALMQAFGNKEPYQLEWLDSSETFIPFLAKDPLPVIQVEIKGELYNFLIDTGAGDTFIDEKLIASLGIKTVEMSNVQGTFAGDKTAEIKYGILDSMTIGNVKINNVPVILHSTAIMKALSSVHKKNKISLDGIIGVGIFKQFLTTMDYQKGQLVFCQRNAEYNVVNDNSITVPFVLESTHLLIGKGEINGKEVNVFFDSGLAIDEKAILLPNETVSYVDLPIDKKGFGLGATGGGIGLIRFRYFNVDTFGLSQLLEVKNISGLSGVFPESVYFDKEIGFFIDSLISHNFFRNYKWTIDFDSHYMSFTP